MKRHEAEEAARKRASQREKAARKAAEKAGRLDAYIRDKQKTKEAATRVEAERIRKKDADKRAAKKYEQKRQESGLSDKEWKAKEAQQAIWDANGAAIWAMKQTTVGPKVDASPIKQADDPYAGIGNWVEKQDDKNTAMLVSAKLQYNFGIRTQGYNTPDVLMSILEAAELSGSKFGELLNLPADEAFRTTHGEIEMILNPEAVFGNPKDNCITYGGEITCKGVPTVPNTIHEMGHAFENYQATHGENSIASDLDPVKKSDGRYLDWDDDTNSWLRKEEGFIAGRESMENKIDIDDRESRIDGDAKQEQFADMYMNWILDGNPDYPKNGFSDDAAGDARSKYMNDEQIPWALGID